VPSPQAQKLLDELRRDLAERLDGSGDAREIYEQAMGEFPAAEGAALSRLDIDGVPALRVTAAGAADEIGVVYMHGGGFGVGSAESNQDLLARLGHAAECAVVGIDYRLLPEGSFPNALEDALRAYRRISGDAPRAPVIAGSSAGGGLALAAAIALRDEEEVAPAGIICLSPWVDMTVSAPSLTQVSDGDWLGRETLVVAAETYLDGREPTDPLASPLHADLSGLPPMLIQVGGSEILLDDARRLADAARRAGTRAELDVWPGMFHNFQLFGARLDEAAAALVRAGEWVRDRLTRERTTR
jgi:monoterpene epsilon-lactone hydrolase